MKKSDLIKEAHSKVTAGVDWYFAEAFLGFVKSDLIHHLDKEGLVKLIKYFDNREIKEDDEM